MQIKAECAAQALADAGLTWKDVDAVYDTGGDQGIGGLGASEYFGFNPRVIDDLRWWHLDRISNQPRPRHDRCRQVPGRRGD
jgi:hypothetical protein